jgi:hypothetical protein
LARYQPRGPFLSVNAKQFAQPAFQVGPNRCKSDHGCHFVHVAQLDQSAIVRRWRSQVRFLPWTPVCPCAWSSNRASFVNSYSSVQVRPGAPFHGDHDVRAASRPVTAFVPVRIRLVTPISTGCRIGLSPVTRVVAGSSPASGSKCRGSSVVEHVFPVRYPSIF